MKSRMQNLVRRLPGCKLITMHALDLSSMPVEIRPETFVWTWNMCLWCSVESIDSSKHDSKYA